MFGVIDGNELLMRALIGGVLGVVGGACYGVVAYLTHKSEAKKESEWEARERARIHAQMHPQADKGDKGGKSIPAWFILLVVLAVIVGVLVANPSLVAPFLPNGGGPK